ncbi:MAG: hypothetical protein QGG71_24880, partial [Pirellulaceae bacterium]|nr:hypothetical protein [Pirellulaceae bacterium]
RSFALAEIIARSGGESLPKNLVEFEAAFDKALAADTQSELDELLKSDLPKLEPGWERFYEFHLLGGLGARADLPWPLLKLALAIRREGEKAAAELLSGSGWARESLEIPDRLRWEAERLIRTRAASDWDTLASANLENARTLYKDAARSLRVVSQSGRLRDRVLARGRDYLHWRGLSRKDREDGVPSQSDIETLFEEVRRLDEALKSPRSDVASVQNQLDRLQSIVDDVEKGVTADAIAQLVKAEYSGDAWRMKILLDTKLPSADLRQSLGEKVADVSTKLSKTFTFGRGRLRPTTTEGRAITAEDWQLAKNRLEAEGLFASLSQCSSAPAINAALEGFDDLDDQARWKVITEASELLQGFYAALPDAIRTWMQANGDYSIAEQRARLRAAAHDMHLLYPRDAAKLEEDLELQASVRRTAWYDLLAWHSQRFRNAAADATDNELQWLIDARGDYRKLASKVLANQPLPAYVKRGLRLEETPPQIDLSSRDQLQAEVEFNIVGTEMPVWLILQYDNDLLQVQSFENNPDRTYHEHDLRHEVRELAAENPDGGFVGRTASQSDDYPYRPDLFELPSTLRLPPNGTTAVKLRIRRQNGADGSAKLVVKAIGKDTYVRREIEIALPSQAKYQLLVEGEDRQRSLNRNGDGVVLRALPNRVQDFALQIVNATRSPGKVTAELYATRYDVPVVFEQGPLPPSQAAALLKRFRPLQRFGHSEIEFLATDEAKRVTFPPSKPEEPGPKIVAIPQEDADGIELPGLPAPSGLLMVITDVPTGHKTFRRIQFQARRPRDYLVATATYLSVQERLEIKLTASDENVIPDDGLTIECGFEGLEAGTEATKVATLSPPKYEATLSAVVPKGSKVIARVAVDEYPRAFVFDMNCRDTVQKQEPLKDMEEIRIESPERGEAYPGSAKTIKVRVAVDAPWGSFKSKSDYVEVGIDPDRDRELDDDETLQLFADRQVEYFVKAIQPDGTLRINTQAGDFELDVPVGRRNVRAYLLGRLVVDSNDTWSTEAQEPVEVVIDDSSPEIEKTTALDPPSREIPIDGDFEVLIRANDTNSEGVALSGVKMIEVAFDKGGEFSENKPVEMAKLRPADGVWIAKMKAADLAEGNYVIVVRPTDKVGNFEKQRGELYGIEVTIVAPTSAEKGMTVTNAVIGKLSHGKNPFSKLKDSEVTLTSEGEPLETRQVRINPQGGFAFSKVPPGKYILSAKAFSANGWRKVENMKVTVSSDPKTPVQLGVIKVKTSKTF